MYISSWMSIFNRFFIQKICLLWECGDRVRYKPTLNKVYVAMRLSHSAPTSLFLYFGRTEYEEREKEREWVWVCVRVRVKERSQFHSLSPPNRYTHTYTQTSLNERKIFLRFCFLHPSVYNKSYLSAFLKTSFG